MTAFPNRLAEEIWADRYRFAAPGGVAEPSIHATWERVARALAAVEPEALTLWEGRFRDALADFNFLPGGRIQAGAGTRHHVTLFNCFVMGAIEDSIAGIFDALKESALTMQQGGGIGLDFSTLRPQGMAARGVGVAASGPLSFMHIWDSMCATILSTGARRGAMMATLRCDHPDIEAFVEAKRDPHALRHSICRCWSATRLWRPWSRCGMAAAFPGGESRRVHCRALVRRRAHAVGENRARGL